MCSLAGWHVTRAKEPKPPRIPFTPARKLLDRGIHSLARSPSKSEVRGSVPDAARQAAGRSARAGECTPLLPLPLLKISAVLLVSFFLFFFLADTGSLQCHPAGTLCADGMQNHHPHGDVVGPFGGGLTGGIPGPRSG
jgi:hypothetical protein